MVKWNASKILRRGGGGGGRPIFLLIINGTLFIFKKQ